MFYALTAQCARNNRSRTDAEFFHDHPDSPWRMTIHRFNRDYFTFRLVTRDGSLIVDGDKWDWVSKLDRTGGGSPLERFQRAVRFLLADPNRTYRARAA
jgi:hypothetical protein